MLPPGGGAVVKPVCHMHIVLLHNYIVFIQEKSQKTLMLNHMGLELGLSYRLYSGEILVTHAVLSPELRFRRGI